ncbi:hypothetical protein GIB67_040864, partial [Kingdonia uniflora]
MQVELAASRGDMRLGSADSGCSGRFEVDGYVYNAEEEPKILMTGKWNKSMSYQPCDMEGEPLPCTELKEVWRVTDPPENDKFQYTYFAHKLNSPESAPRKLSRLRPDRYALEKGDMSKAGAEKRSLKDRRRAEKKNREVKDQQFTPRWFELTEEIKTTPYGDLDVYQHNVVDISIFTISIDMHGEVNRSFNWKSSLLMQSHKSTRRPNSCLKEK